MTGWIIAAVLAGIALYGVWLYNRLVAQRHQVRNGWSQIDVQLKRRHDLVPNLVKAVKAYMSHEQTVLERVVEARSQAIAAGSDVTARARSENELTGALRQLFALAESYPELKASQNMLALQEELASTENRIAFARQFYSDCVLRYNTVRDSFPTAMIAGPLGFEPAVPFAIDMEAERAAPAVAF